MTISCLFWIRFRWNTLNYCTWIINLFLYILLPKVATIWPLFTPSAKKVTYKWTNWPYYSILLWSTRRMCLSSILCFRILFNNIPFCITIKQFEQFKIDTFMFNLLSFIWFNCWWSVEYELKWCNFLRNKFS